MVRIIKGGDRNMEGQYTTEISMQSATTGNLYIVQSPINCRRSRPDVLAGTSLNWELHLD